MKINYKASRGLLSVLFLVQFLFFLNIAIADMPADKSVVINASGGKLEQLKNKFKPLVPAYINSASTYNVDDELGVLYAPQQKKIIFKRVENKTTVFEGSAPETGLKLHANDKRVYAFWWNKTKNGKTMRVKSSTDAGKTFDDDIAYIAKKGVLPTLTVADDGQDKVAVAYISEREPGYQVYFNRSLDGGKTWFKEDLRMNTLYGSDGPIAANKPLKKLSGGSHVTGPFLSYIGNKLVLIWQEVAIFEGKRYLRLVNRISLDDGKTWSDENEIFKIKDIQPQGMNINKFGNELFISIFLPKVGVFTFNSEKELTQWQKSKVLAASEGIKTISYFHSAKNKNGDKFLSFVFSPKSGKDKVKLFRNLANSDDWKDITQEITAKEKENKQKPYDAETKSTAIVVESFLDNGIIVAWQDYTSIISSTLVNYSKDGGKTWLDEPFAIATPGKVLTQDPYFVKGDTKLWLIVSYFDVLEGKGGSRLFYLPLLEKTSKGNVVLNAYPVDSFQKKISKEKKLSMLRKRTNEFWRHRVAEEYDKAYEFFDPLYRLQFKKIPFLQTQGKIRYLKAKSGKIEMYDNIAFVDTKITFSLTVFDKVPGIQSEPSVPQEREMKGRWGWFYDNWYLMPQTLFDNRFKY